MKQAFLNPHTGKQKDIECIRVDSGRDEGPVHEEVHDGGHLRQRHMVKGLPVQYVFYLKCCFDSKCIHSVCQSGASADDIWHPNDPP